MTLWLALVLIALAALAAGAAGYALSRRRASPPAAAAAQAPQAGLAEITAVLREPATVAALEAGGYTVTGGTPAEYAEYLKASGLKWKTLFNKMGITPQ